MKRLHFLICGTAMVAAIALGAPPDEGRDGSGSKPVSPTDITADAVDYDMKIRQAVFSGNVHVVDDRLNMTADRMTVDFTEKNKLKRIVATGKVVVQRREERATGGRADYDVLRQSVTLTKAPVLHLRENRLVGAERVVYERAAGKFRTEGGRPRLKVVLPADEERLDPLESPRSRPGEE